MRLQRNVAIECPTPFVCHRKTKQHQDIKFNQADKLGVGHRELALKSEKGIPPK